MHAEPISAKERQFKSAPVHQNWGGSRVLYRCESIGTESPAQTVPIAQTVEQGIVDPRAWVRVPLGTPSSMTSTGLAPRGRCFNDNSSA